MTVRDPETITREEARIRDVPASCSCPYIFAAPRMVRVEADPACAWHSGARWEDSRAS